MRYYKKQMVDLKIKDPKKNYNSLALNYLEKAMECMLLAENRIGFILIKQFIAIFKPKLFVSANEEREG